MGKPTAFWFLVSAGLGLVTVPLVGPGAIFIAAPIFLAGYLVIGFFALAAATKRGLNTSPPAPKPSLTPSLPPPPEDRFTRAKRKFDDAVKRLDQAGLTDYELKAAKEKSRQKYLKDLNEGIE